MMYRVICVAAFAVVLQFAPCNSPAMADVVVSIPELIPALPNSIVNVSVNISAVTDMAAFELRLIYDTDHLDLSNIDVSPGSILPSDWVVVTNVQDTAGEAIISAFGTTNVSDVGEILDLSFHATFWSGITDLELEDVFVWGYDDNNEEIEIGVTTIDGSIEITSIPEPSTIAIWGFLAISAGVVTIARRRRRSQSA